MILDTGFLISVDRGEDAARSFLASAPIDAPIDAPIAYGI